MIPVDDISQVDPVLCEDGRNVGFYAWTDDDETFFWSIPLPMMVEEVAFESLLPEWVELGWKMLMQQG
ncbi:hypothetical protein [Rhizobium ecuadorense]|uniref:hypothetical protein n=1 Tax=Rhizobium ecuadorense TaxID=1671795 RepID=UPI0006736133|nr:hypothetical protein [Rhizobium ecuadorense]